MNDGPPTAKDITDVLRNLHRSFTGRDAWAFFDELRLGTGFHGSSAQSIDAFAISLWPSKGWGTYAYEIKVRRADFLCEIKQPLKRRPALRFSNLFFFVTPEGLVKPEEIPIECGLLEVRRNEMTLLGDHDQLWKSQVVVPAPWRDVPPPTWNLFAAVARRVQHEEKSRGPDGDGSD